MDERSLDPISLYQKIMNETANAQDFSNFIMKLWLRRETVDQDKYLEFIREKAAHAKETN